MNVTYVDAEDRVIGAGTIANAVDQGIIVRISRVFLRSSKGELLLQKRANEVGSWDQTAGGHVDEGEDYATAAARELAEEMGIADVELTEIATFYSEEAGGTKLKKRFNKIFSGTYDGKVEIDTDEVADYKWISLAELDRQMEQNSSNFPQGFIEAYKIYKKTIAG